MNTKHKKTSPRCWLATLLLVALVGEGGVLLFLGARVGLAAYQLYDAISSLRMLATSPAANMPAVPWSRSGPNPCLHPILLVLVV